VARARDLPELVRMLREYADALGVDLSFQDFERELAELPGDYASARGGGLWLAFAGAAPAGCVALRRLDGATCEMKRLYVRTAVRGAGLGRTLAQHVIGEARRRGYERMRLDTLPEMGAAQQLYLALGFQPIPPYRHNPVPGASFWELVL
jgi:GNAT superfamily N-acetyltransferase